jgi:hypothetical protein
MAQARRVGKWVKRSGAALAAIAAVGVAARGDEAV